jgi:GNAT superfamily N-acetyltransferase
MPKVQRKDIPRALLEHLLQRIHQRSIDAQALKSLAIWLDTNPEVPAGMGP